MWTDGWIYITINIHTKQIFTARPAYLLTATMGLVFPVQSGVFPYLFFKMRPRNFKPCLHAYMAYTAVNAQCIQAPQAWRMRVS